MLKKRFFSFGVLIVLIIACVILVAALFIFSSVPAVKTTGFGATVSGGSGSSANGDSNLPPASVTEWELPAVVSLTGEDSAAGLAAGWGFDYGVKSVNEEGGIRGIPAKIAVRDTASSEDGVADEINRLTPDALVIMGPSTDVLYKAGEVAFYNARVPVIGAATDVEARTASKPYSISCITDSAGTTESVAETWIRADRFTTVCTLYAPANEDRVKSIETALTADGKNIVDSVQIGNDAFDAASVADRVFSSGADAYYIDMSGENTLRVITQMRFLAGANAGKLLILCGPAVADQTLVDSATEGDLYGVRVWATLDPGKDIEKHKAFDEAYDKNVVDPAYHDMAVDYYQSAFMIKQAIESLGLTGDPGSLADERGLLANWLYNTELIQTDLGDFNMQDGAKNTEVKIYKITDKGFQ